MKIALASDIHLEFADINLQNTENADVLILSGDICVAEDIGKPDPNNFLEGARSSRIVDFFKRCSFQFPHVVYVMGNHEHYHGDFAKTTNRINTDHPFENVSHRDFSFHSIHSPFNLCFSE